MGADVYYNVHRWYEYQTGKYSRPDPLGVRLDSNPYRYARSNPIMLVDPLGLVAWSCTVLEVSAGAVPAGAGFYVECDTGCVDGQRARGGYLIGAGGLSVGATPIEAGAWDLEDGTDKPDPSNLEGVFKYRGCSVTPLIGVSVAEVFQGKGQGSFSLTPTFGLGAGCFVGSGRSKMILEEKGCCPESPVVRAPDEQ